jgi:NEDD8-activating enzyme E1 regulatory subunit
MAEAVIDKAEKYDRQIRLWGPQGQQRIEDASVVLLNATPTGTETLKNLILPGRNSYILPHLFKVLTLSQALDHSL